ncbi:MAG: formylglycine-generating enzyme family protein [Gemmatimonadota bacterium]|nr:formylglycine-generating enzyme family protein [Gemmatimonadota bacterium]
MIRPLGALTLALAFTAVPARAQPSTTSNAIGLEFVLVQPGSMLVGKFQPACPDSTTRRVAPTMDPRALWNADDYARCAEMVMRDAQPGFRVTIGRPYYIGKYEVTQAQWRRVVGTNPSVFQGSKVNDEADMHPVDNITWADAQHFIERLNAMDRTAHYRLPTEFEWEYAARAGANEEPTWALIHDTAWEQDVDKGTTHAVGGKMPNAWGLYDMLGNVWEWVNDYYNERLFADPMPPRTGTTHVLRGGSFVSDVKNTTWFTHAGGPGSGFDVGFRIVRDVP